MVVRTLVIRQVLVSVYAEILQNIFHMNASKKPIFEDQDIC